MNGRAPCHQAAKGKKLFRHDILFVQGVDFNAFMVRIRSPVVLSLAIPDVISEGAIRKNAVDSRHAGFRIYRPPDKELGCHTVNPERVQEPLFSEVTNMFSPRAIRHSIGNRAAPRISNNDKSVSPCRISFSIGN
jgi:hypothetical protein